MIEFKQNKQINNKFACLDRSVDGDRDLSDSEESPPSRYRSYSQPPSRRGSIDYSNQSGPNQRPALMVRRVGSRQMLVLGDEASIHGKKITCPVINVISLAHLVTNTIQLFSTGRVSKI